MDIKWPAGDIKLLEWQSNLLKDESDYIAICAGRGSGKTFGLVLKMLSFAMTLYAERCKIAFRRFGSKVRILYVTPRIDMGADALNCLLSLIPKEFVKGKHYWYEYSTNSKSVRLFDRVCGIEILFRSGFNTNGIRGKSADMVVLDEFAFFGSAVDQEKIRQQGRDGENFLTSTVIPCLTRPYTRGRLLLSSTPFYGNFFDRIITRIETGENFWRRFSLYRVSFRQNTLLGEDERKKIEEIGAISPIKFRCEYLAETNIIYKDESRAEARYLSDDMLDKCSVASFSIGKKIAPYYAMAVDLAWQGEDRTAVVVGDIHNNRVVHVQYHQTADEIKNASIIKQVQEAFDIAPSKIIIDATMRGQSVVRYLPFKVEEFRFSEVTKTQIFDMLKTAISNGGLEIPHFAAFDFTSLPQWNTFPDQNQLVNFERLYREMASLLYWEEKRRMRGLETMVKKYREDTRYHDDAVCALAMFATYLKQDEVIAPKKQTFVQGNPFFGM